MGRRQRDRYGDNPNKLVPNYQGQVCENWTEAQSLASKDKDVSEQGRSAAVKTYDKLVKKEPKKIMSSGTT